jgi:hypothetical protein
LSGCSHGKRRDYARSNHHFGNPDFGSLAVDAEERRKDMILNDENISEKRRQLDVINAIPSAKFDADPLKNISDQDMDEFNAKHLRDLHDQVMAYDEQELECVAEAIVERGWTFAFNALGFYFEKLVRQREATKVINQA